jgi:hypothetical protein
MIEVRRPRILFPRDDYVALRDDQLATIRDAGYDCISYPIIAGQRNLGMWTSEAGERIRPYPWMPDTDFVLVKMQDHLGLYPTWDPSARGGFDAEYHEFPPEWSEIWVLNCRGFFFTNRRHVLSQRLIRAQMSIAEWQENEGKGIPEPSDPDDEILMWLLNNFFSVEPNVWQGIMDQHGRLYTRIIELLKAYACLPLRWLRIDTSELVFAAGSFTESGPQVNDIITPQVSRRAKQIGFPDGLQVALPSPGKWLIDVDDS